MPLVHTIENVLEKAIRTAGVTAENVIYAEIIKRSVDARKKDQVHYVYRVELLIPDTQRYAHSRNVTVAERVDYAPEITGTRKMSNRPVVVGLGPAGLFAGFLLAKNGYAPIIIERGRPVDARVRDVEQFWQTGILDKSSNVQFGEGGAGAFSDGKLNTGVKDKYGRNRFVLETFVRFGAPKDIVYDAKPHIGTDVLVRVIANMRNEMIRLGADVRYETKLTGFEKKSDLLSGILVNETERVDADVCILSIGHSARDTFCMLHKENIPMEAKPFAVGLRIEHPQHELDRIQYGPADPALLPRASYKLTGRTSGGRSAYTFCMCPGGYVVNASSEERRLAVNGMSNRAQDSANANSAVVLTVPVTDFKDSSDPLSGMYYQQELETKAWELGQGKIPQQLFADYEGNRVSESYGQFSSCVKGSCSFANLRVLFSDEMNTGMVEAIHSFGKKIHGFDRPDAILSGVESRTSSPVRIVRDESCQSSLRGLYPCGEGAGYAGGISSAAMDGLRCAEAVMREWQPNKG